MNLIVRVKRRRSQNPSDSLWIADDAGVPSKKRSTRQLTASLQALSTSITDDDQEKLACANKKLFLQRIQTVEIGVESELDKSALSASVSKTQKRGRIEIETSEGTNPPSSEAIVLPAAVTALESSNDDPSSMWITSGKKVLRSSYTLEKFVVVDVTQIPFSRPSSTYSRSLTGERSTGIDDSSSKKTLNNAPKKSVVIDPATRKLDAAIEKAFKLNDFNEMAQALQIGANVNHQRQADGLSALMVAAMQKNNRMASRLVAKGADVFLLDKNGRSAMDYVKKGHNQAHTGNSHLQNASVEISLLLHRSAVSAQNQANRLQRRSDEEEDAMKSINENSSSTESPNQQRSDINSSSVSNSNSSSSGMGGVIAGGSWVIDSMKSHTADSNVMENEIQKVPEKVEGEKEKGVGAGAGAVEGEEDSDYVVDIYMQSDVKEGENPSTPKITDPGSHIPVVQVDGLHITVTGNVELVFEYDSDWSDLADDEDPDSNDERFAGNDYPEEEGYGDGGEDEDEDSEDEEKYAMLRADIEDRQEGGFSERNRKVGPNDAEERACMNGLDYGFSGGNGSSRRINRFNRNSVGRVLRPHMMDESGEGGVMSSNRDPQALQDLWGLQDGGNEDDDYEEDEDDDEDNVAANSKFRSERAEQNERIKGMRAGTGMQFAANPREFARSGLPKYGADLSDDDGDVELYDSSLKESDFEAQPSMDMDLDLGLGLDSSKQNSRVTFAPTSRVGVEGRTGSVSLISKGNAIEGVNLGNIIERKAGTGTGFKQNQAGIDRMAMLRNDVRESASARARGDLTGDLSYPMGERGGGRGDLFRPLRTTIAYDSDLDMQSSDDGSD